MKKLFLIISVIAMLALVGCSQNNEKDTNGSPDVFIGGSQGVIAEFEIMGLDTEGIEEVWVGNDFPVEITVKNKGEENIAPNDLSIKIQGIDANLFNLGSTEVKNSAELEKISEFNTLGGEETLSFGTARLDSITGISTDAHFFGTVEYKYKTYVAVPSVCFKADYQDDSVCELSGNKKVHSSSAPITVSKVTQEPSGSKRISLIFEVQNVGGGEVAPVAEDFNNNYDKLDFELTEGEGSGVTFDCSSAGSKTSARFSDGKTLIHCKSSELPEDTLYTKQLTLELSYKYKDIIQKDLRIRNEP